MLCKPGISVLGCSVSYFESTLPCGWCFGARRFLGDTTGRQTATQRDISLFVHIAVLQIPITDQLPIYNRSYIQWTVANRLLRTTTQSFPLPHHQGEMPSSAPRHVFRLQGKTPIEIRCHVMFFTRQPLRQSPVRRSPRVKVRPLPPHNSWPAFERNQPPPC